MVFGEGGWVVPDTESFSVLRTFDALGESALTADLLCGRSITPGRPPSNNKQHKRTDLPVEHRHAAPREQRLEAEEPRGRAVGARDGRVDRRATRAVARVRRAAALEEEDEEERAAERGVCWLRTRGGWLRGNNSTSSFHRDALPHSIQRM